MPGNAPIMLFRENWRWRAGSVTLTLAGLALLGVWAFCWKSSLTIDRLRGGHRTWIPVTNQLGIDFLNNYYASRHWLKGGNPYTEPIGDPLNRPFVYSPVLLWLFSWCRFFSALDAVRVWMGMVAVMACIGAGVAWRTRRALGLAKWPFLWVLALVLGSTPVMFALERGNCDLLVVMLMIVTATALRRTSLTHDVIVGLCVALATWLKIYPGIVAIGLLAVRRPRGLLCTGIAYVAIGLIDLPGTFDHIESMRRYISSYDIGFDPSAHPFATNWKYLWKSFDWGGRWTTRISRVPGVVGAGLSLFPIVLWVSLQIFRCPRREELFYPYLCWLTAVATFMPPVSNDYNLAFLPLAALAVWDRRDPLAVHMLMGFMALWWQPVSFAINPMVLFLFKLAGIAAVGMSIVQRSRELRQEIPTRQLHSERDRNYPVAAAA